jgi:hypothetical protein
MPAAPLSIASKVERRILQSKDSQIVWTIHSFSNYPSGAVARILSRLCKKRIIKRIRKGVYYRPIKTILGASVPNQVSVATAAAAIKGQHAILGGHTAYNALGLTTQVAGKTTLVIGSPIRSSSLKNKRIRAVTRPIYPGMVPTERAVLDALRDINHISDTTPQEIVSRVIHLLSSGKLSFERLARFALRSEPPRVRALLGAIGEYLDDSLTLLTPLRKSLNQTTMFKIKLGNSLPSARNWNVVG